MIREDSSIGSVLLRLRVFGGTRDWQACCKSSTPSILQHHCLVTRRHSDRHPSNLEGEQQLVKCPAIAIAIALAQALALYLRLIIIVTMWCDTLHRPRRIWLDRQRTLVNLVAHG